MKNSLLVASVLVASCLALVSPSLHFDVSFRKAHLVDALFRCSHRKDARQLVMKRSKQSEKQNASRVKGCRSCSHRFCSGAFFSVLIATVLALLPQNEAGSNKKCVSRNGQNKAKSEKLPDCKVASLKQTLRMEEVGNARMPLKSFVTNETQCQTSKEGCSAKESRVVGGLKLSKCDNNQCR